MSKYRIAAIFVFIFSIHLIIAQNDNELELWRFKTDNRVQGTPYVWKNFVFVGGIDGNLYALSLKTGTEIWKFKSGNPISAEPAVFQGNVFFESGNTLYSLNAKTGNKNWEVNFKCKKIKLKTDQWDYHHASIKIFDEVLYFASSDGNVYQIDPKSSKVLYSYKTLEESPVRTTPNVENGILFFGDWNGVIYAFDIETKKQKWVYKSVDKKPYPTFGGILSQIFSTETHLYFGARNNNLMCLEKNTGKLAWTFNDPTGGWISGDPVVENGKLYIGGSDNHKFFCFDALSGKLIWDFKFFGNCLSKPQLIKDKIVFTTGDAYKNTLGQVGKGFIYVLNKTDGRLLNSLELEGNVFSSPVYVKKRILFGSDDGNIYALKANEFLEAKKNPEQ